MDALATPRSRSFSTPRPIDALEAELATLAANISAATCRWLGLLAEFDRREGWAGWGIKSCAHWLNWRCGIDLRTARDQVRVAHALDALPTIAAEFARGALSYSKVRAMTRIATPENEENLLMIARHGTASHVEALVRGYRRSVRLAQTGHANAAHDARAVHWHWDDDGMLVLDARLPSGQGALLLKALDAIEAQCRDVEHRHADAESNAHADTGSAELPAEIPARGSAEPRPVQADDDRTPSQRRADALILLAETTLAGDAPRASTADRYLVTLHVDAGALMHRAEGRCALADGPVLAVETARRLCCDGSTVTLHESADGDVLNVGRRTRTLPPALRRALQYRDRGCRFPGCTSTRFVDGHHLEHWADGGETALSNLVLLCRCHHRLVHEGGWRIERLHDGALRFLRPDTRRMPAAPTPPDPGGADLEAENALLGHVIHAGTGESLWHGEPMDLNTAVGHLWWLQERAIATQ